MTPEEIATVRSVRKGLRVYYILIVVLDTFLALLSAVIHDSTNFWVLIGIMLALGVQWQRLENKWRARLANTDKKPV